MIETVGSIIVVPLDRGRGTHADVSIRRQPDDPLPIGAALDEVMASLRGPDRRRVSGLFGGWEEIVGPAVAAHVRPVRLDAGVLVVEVDDPSWATQLAFLADTVRGRLAEVAEVTVERLEVRVARGRVAGRRDTPLVD